MTRRGGGNTIFFLGSVKVVDRFCIDGCSGVAGAIVRGAGRVGVCTTEKGVGAA